MTDMELYGTAKKYLEIKHMISDWEAALQKLEDAIKAEMGEAEIRSVEGITIRYKHIATTRLDTKALLADAPGLYEKYAAVTHSRRFTIN